MSKDTDAIINTTEYDDDTNTTNVKISVGVVTIVKEIWRGTQIQL